MDDDRMLMAKVADLYYMRHMTQQTIAHRLGLSRPTVSRLLQRARAEGIVRITVAHPLEAHSTLERELEERYGLQEAIVVTGRSESPKETRRTLGQAAARSLERLLAGGEHIGISWGTTLSAVLDHLTPRPMGVTVVPVVGGLGQVNPSLHANDLASRLAAALEGRVHLLHAPAVVASARIREALLSDSRIGEVLDLARRVRVALVGIGGLVPSSTVVQSGYFSTEELAGLRDRGAVGDVCTRPFTRDGRTVDEALDRRILAITLEDLRAIPIVIAVAGGLEKAEAIAGALRGGLVDVLVTDHLAARAVLRSQETRRGTAS